MTDLDSDEYDWRRRLGHTNMTGGGGGSGDYCWLLLFLLLTTHAPILIFCPELW